MTWNPDDKENRNENRVNWNPDDEENLNPDDKQNWNPVGEGNVYWNPDDKENLKGPNPPIKSYFEGQSLEILTRKEPRDFIYRQESLLAEFLEKFPHGSSYLTSLQPDIFSAEHLPGLFYNPKQDLENVRRSLEALDTLLPSLDIMLFPDERQQAEARYNNRVAFISKEETAFRERVEAAKKAGAIDTIHYERIMGDLLSPYSPFNDARRKAETKYRS